MHASSVPIRTRLLFLVLATVTPAVFLLTAFLISDYLQERRRLESSTTDTARALATALDQRLAVAQAALSVLATSRLLWNENLPAFYAQASEVKTQHGIAVIGLLSADMQPLMNTLQPLGTPLRQPGSASQVRAVFETGQPVVTNLFEGSVYGTYAVAVAAPVIRERKAAYALVAGIDPASIASLLGSQKLPEGWVAAVTDRNGRIVARSSEHARFIGAQVRENLISSMQQNVEGSLDGVSLAGVPVVTAFSKAPVSGWRVVISIPRSQLTAALTRDLTLVVAGTACVLATSLFIAWRFGRNITRTVQALKEQARSLGRGDPVASLPGAFSEAGELSEALRQASVELTNANRDLVAQKSELQQSSDRLGGLVESAMDAIVSTDGDRNLLLFNAAAERMFGWKREDVLGRPLEMLLPHRYRDGHRAHVATFAASGATTRRMGALAVVAGLRADGSEFPLEASISQIDTPGGKVFTAVIRDVSEKLRAAEELTTLRAEASAMRERDKKRIARELHDDVVQTLAVLKLEENWLVARQLDSESERRLRRMIGLTDGAVVALRRIASDLRPLALDELGFTAALEDLVETFSERTGTPCRLQIKAIEELQDPHATELFRLVQEALSNVAKHSQATQVEVHVESSGQNLVVTVRDDGIGFVPDAPRSRESMGMAGLRERVQLLRGSLNIDSRPGAGTTVQVIAPTLLQ